MGGWLPGKELPLPLRIELYKFGYLGIQITRDMEGYMTENIQPMLKKLDGDVRRWRTLPLSLVGRAAMFKMIALP
mgnify:CR=1 FL=1